MEMGFASAATSPVVGGSICCTCRRQSGYANLREAAEAAIMWPSRQAAINKQRSGQLGVVARQRRRSDVAAKVGESDVVRFDRIVPIVKFTHSLEEVFSGSDPSASLWSMRPLFSLLSCLMS